MLNVLLLWCIGNYDVDRGHSCVCVLLRLNKTQSDVKKQSHVKCFGGCFLCARTCLMTRWLHCRLVLV